MTRQAPGSVTDAATKGQHRMGRQHLESSIFAGRPSAAAAAARARRRRRRGNRRLVVLVVALAVVAGAGYLAFSSLRSLVSGVTESNDYEGAGTGRAVVTVKAGDTGRSIADTLVAAGVVKTAKAFSDAAEQDPQAAGIQPGSYTLRQRMSAASALAMLLDPANRSVPKVTVREGLWASEVFALLSKATGTPLADYQAAVKDPGSIGLPAVAKGNVEGYLFPDSYEFEPKASAASQLRTLVTEAVHELERLAVPPARYQRVLTVASIVEAEARREADRPKVARVVENRLAGGQMLQMDSTIAYALQRRGRITTTDAERATVSPYNTYRVTGLPPGPIGNPGRSAIEGAVHPVAGPWLFFVTVDPSTGETRFNTDAAGHQQDVLVFQAWCRAHPGKC